MLICRADTPRRSGGPLKNRKASRELGRRQVSGQLKPPLLPFHTIQPGTQEALAVISRQ